MIQSRFRIQNYIRRLSRRRYETSLSINNVTTFLLRMYHMKIYVRFKKGLWWKKITYRSSLNSTTFMSTQLNAFKVIFFIKPKWYLMQTNTVLSIINVTSKKGPKKSSMNHAVSWNLYNRKHRYINKRGKMLPTMPDANCRVTTNNSLIRRGRQPNSTRTSFIGAQTIVAQTTTYPK